MQIWLACLPVTPAGIFTSCQRSCSPSPGILPAQTTSTCSSCKPSYAPSPHANAPCAVSSAVHDAVKCTLCLRFCWLSHTYPQAHALHLSTHTDAHIYCSEDSAYPITRHMPLLLMLLLVHLPRMYKCSCSHLPPAHA
jgi:hypothetical protein